MILLKVQSAAQGWKSFTSAHPSVGAGWLLRPRIYFVTRSLVLTPVQSSTRCITLGKLLMFVPSFLFCNKKKIVMYNLLVLILCLELREVLNTQMSNLYWRNLQTYLFYVQKVTVLASSVMNKVKKGLKCIWETSLAAQWLRLRLPKPGVQIQSLIGELRSHMPRSQKTKT